MRKLKYHVACTVDGFIAHKDHTIEGFIPEGDHVTDYLEDFTELSSETLKRWTWLFFIIILKARSPNLKSVKIK